MHGRAILKLIMKTKKLTFLQALPYILLIGGIIGAFCAGMLTWEKINILEHPSATLNCDLNPVVACGPVINTKQAAAFGFPNPFMGLFGFGVITAVGAAMLAGATFKRWFWLGLQTGVTFGIAFTIWLQYQSLFTIGALCPFCMVVWAIMIPMFWYTTLYNIQAGNIKLSGKLAAVGTFAQKYHADILLVWYLIIIGLILNRFWYYWSTLI